MSLTVKRQFVPVVDDTAIASFEKLVGVRLPQEYRDFLVKFNGGEPENAVFRFGNGRASYGDSAVRYFFSITNNSTFSLAHKYEIYADAGRIPKGMLPIAADAGGNLVLLALAGSQCGKVFFWDHEVEGLVDNPSSIDNLVLVGDSFDQFCA
jgi:hypothetical protein